jgi:hypothetical protein
MNMVKLEINPKHGWVFNATDAVSGPPRQLQCDHLHTFDAIISDHEVPLVSSTLGRLNAALGEVGGCLGKVYIP